MTIQLSKLLPVPTGTLSIPSHVHDGGVAQNDQADQDLLKLSLVIPTYNERRNVAAIVEQLSTLLDRVIPGEYELIFVDDDSPDRTWEAALELAAEYPQVQVMRRQQERGLSTAVIRGWQAARGEILGVIDGDLQHPPEVLLNLLRATDRKADLAVASRHVEGGGVSEWSAVRRFLSRGAQVLGLVILPQVVGRVSDPMSGYFLVRRSAIAERTLSPIGYKILLEVLGRGRINQVIEVGYVFQERLAGESKVTWRQYVDYISHLLRLRFQARSRHLLPQQDAAATRSALPLPVHRFIRYCLVGFSGVFVDMAVFYLLSDPSALAWGLTRSKIIAAECGIINNFLWNDAWTFGDLSSSQKGWRKRFKRLAKFNVICLAGLILNVLVLNFLFNIFGINRYVSNLIAIAVVTLWNFWLNLKLNWRVTDAGQAAD